MSRNIVHGFDPASDSWKAALNEMPKPKVALYEAEAFIAQVLNNIRRHDNDPERCARKSWTLGAFTLVISESRTIALKSLSIFLM